MEANFQPPIHKRGTLIINQKPYEIEVFMSANDYCKLVATLKEENADYRLAVANLLYSKIISKEEVRPSFKLIAEQNDTLFEAYFNLHFEKDKRLRESYEKFSDITDICKRFIFAVNDEYKEMIKEATNSLKSHINLVDIQDSINLIMSPLKAAMESDRLKSSLSGIINSVSNVGIALEPTLRAVDEVQKNISRYMKNFKNLFGEVYSHLSSIKIPEISEERKEELRLSYCRWGALGWTIPPNAPIDIFNDLPIDSKSANKKVLDYCKAKDMDKLFAFLNSLKGTKKSDLDEAIFNFNNKKYKSCALILFSLIDAKLIRLQRQEE